MKYVVLTFSILSCCIGCNSSGKSGSGSPMHVGTSSQDNTAVNVRDRDSSTKTPINQNENKADVDITAEIRRQVVATQMSVDAQNVKIVTQDGRVTLRGPVKTAEEKSRISAIARSVAGPNQVDDQVEVVANR